MQILIVEDELRLAKALKQILEEKKYMVDTVANGQDGLDYALSGIYDVIILDVMLPKMDGMTVAKKLRESSVSTPIIMLTARDTIKDKITGLDSGADDYMTKPFSPNELLARIRALTRRYTEVLAEVTEFGDFTFNSSVNEISKNGKSINLNYKEAEILKLLLLRKNVPVSKEELITKVWGFNSDAGDSNVEAYMSFVRKKLSFIQSEYTIASYKKKGYMLETANAKKATE
ncbi:MAG: response regulator transcription factor [Clostridia bacterium]|nr:response regulator transcription factor [Clostridia bacterium]